MAQQLINFGTAPDAIDGDTTRTAFTKTQANDAELYGLIGDGTTGNAALSAKIAAVKVTADDAALAQTINGTFRNKLINGRPYIWQRGTSISVPTGFSLYTADRWLASNIGTTTVIDQFNNPPSADLAYPSYIRCTVTSVAGSGNYAFICQKIEGVRNLSGKTVTVSFNSYSSVAGKKIGISIDQNFGTGGSPSATVVGIGQQQILTVAPARYSLTFAVPDILGKTIGTNSNDSLNLIIWLDAGTSLASQSAAIGQGSAVTYLSDIQIEEGSIATPFEVRPVGSELDLCQRYYEKSFPMAVKPAQNAGTSGCIALSQTVGASTNFYGNFQSYKVCKRTAPTVTFFNPSAANALARNGNIGVDCTTTVIGGESGANGFTVTIGTAAGSAAGYSNLLHYTAEAEL